MTSSGLGLPFNSPLNCGFVGSSNQRSKDMKVKSLFLDTVAELPPEKMPSKITKRIKRDGKFIDIAVPRRSK